MSDQKSFIGKACYSSKYKKGTRWLDRIFESEQGDSEDCRKKSEHGVLTANQGMHVEALITQWLLRPKSR